MTMAVIGIDPGLSGALALYMPDTEALDVRDMPTFVLPKGGTGKRTELDLYGLAAIIDGWSALKVRAVVEMVSSSPQMGVASAFSFGGSYWAARMALAAQFIPTELVAPQVWKRDLKVPAAKDGARARASAFLPRHAHNWARAKDDGRAEASLIALWAARNMGAAR
jgi:crossover junction endodeoxyribonuclease RuvC